MPLNLFKGIFDIIFNSIDKQAIHERLKKGGKFSDLKDEYNFAPLIH